MNTKLSVIALVLLLAVPGLLYAFVLDVPGSFATIQAGIDTAAEGDTVLVAPGIYHENLNLSGKSITLASHYITTGDTMYMHKTFIDLQYNKGMAVKIINDETNITTPHIIGFTIWKARDRSNPPERDYEPGRGIYCYYSNPTLEYLIIKDNNVYWSGSGGGISCRYSNPVIRHCTLADNQANGSGGGAHFIESNPILEDVNIIGNYATSGGGIYFDHCDSVKCERMVVRGNDSQSGRGIYSTNSKLTINNSLISPDELRIYQSKVTIIKSTLNMMYLGDSDLVMINSIMRPISGRAVNIRGSGTTKMEIIVAYSFLKRGESDIVGETDYIDDRLSEYADIQFEGTLISGDPLFSGSDFNDIYSYRLIENSPCIDAGTVHFEWDGQTFVTMKEDEYYGSAPDMGFYEFNPNVLVKDNKENIPERIELQSPFPNPFNATVTIPYRIRKGSNISLAVYNCAGQEVAELTNGFHATGMYSAVWNAEGCASGVYYCRLQSGNHSCVEKLLYLK